MDPYLKEALARRGNRGLQSQMEPLHLSDVMPEQKVAAMTEPKDQIQHHDPMKETGPGYETEPESSLSEEGMVKAKGAQDGKESEAKMAKIYDLLGSKNAKGLRGRAMQMHEKKEY